MKIQDAIKSGQRYAIGGTSNPIWFHPRTDNYTYSREEILSENWIIEEKKVEITKSQAIEMFNMGAKMSDLFDDYIKELGFT